jgi:Tfp pilus assembly protein PilP
MKQLPYVWLILLLAVGCSTAAPTPDLQATVDQEVSQAVAATLTAVPTDTPLPHTPTNL